MALTPVLPEHAQACFTEEQQQYLHGFFAAVGQRLPFAGHTISGLITNSPELAQAEPEFFGTPVSDLCAEEMWKYRRNPLDAWDELLAHAAENKAPDAEHRFRFKYHGLFHVAPAQDSFMLRLRAPGGVVTAAQLRGLAAMAEEWGSGRLDLTTRANIQIREFAPQRIVDVLNAVRRLGMSAQGSGADNIRNITASPTSGFDSTESIDVQPFADALANYIANSRDLFGLPRKFNIAFDGGGSVSALADTNDIGFVAVHVPEERSVPAGVYFRVLLSGITGHRQFATDSGLLLRPDQLVAVAAAMVRVFSENGDRTNRKKARLKYLLERWGAGQEGIARFVAETEKKLAFPMLRVPAAECEARGPVHRAAHLGVHPQRQSGFRYIGVCIPVGHLPAEQARAIASVAEQFGSGEVRLTVWQNLLIPNVARDRIEEAVEALLQAGLQISAGAVLRGTVACTGKAGCRFAATDTKRHAVELARSLDARFPILQPVNLHVTGCPHSCAQHYIGDIGLMGVKVNGEEGYQVNLGGGADTDQGMARELYRALPYSKVQLALHNLFVTFERERNAEETLLSFTRRHSVEALQAMCNLAMLEGSVQ